MKRICSALCAVLMLASMVGCSAYSDELTFFESDAVNWDMTMLDAYRYIEGHLFTEDKPSVDNHDDELIEVSGDIYRFYFNTEGRLLTIVYDLGQSAETASVITQKWFGESDDTIDGVRYWYRSLADVDTNVELHEEDGAYRLDFVLMDEEKQNAVHIDLEDLFNEAIAMLDGEDVDGALEAYDILLKAGYVKADKLKKTINEVRMAQYFDKGDYETAWKYSYGVDVMNPDMYKECAYQLAVAAFDTASLDAMEQAVAMMKEHCYLYKNTADYETYLNARKQEATDVLTAKTLYDTLPTDFLDVAHRLTTIAGLEKWKGTFVCTKAGTFKAAEFHFKRTEDADSVQLNLIYTTEPIPGYVHEPFYFFDLASFADAAPFIESNDRLTATFFDGEFVLSYSETGEELTFVRK